MGLLSRLLGGRLRAETPGPIQDFWYQPVGVMTEAGIRVDEETAQKLSAWYRGREILAGWVAKLDFELMERLPNNGGPWPATGHPLYDVISAKPNSLISSYQWRRQSVYHLIDHGAAYARIVAGPRGFADQLWPIHPTLVTPEQISPYRVRYHIRDPKSNRVEILTQDELFRLVINSNDGVHGHGILKHARLSLGTASATENYAAKIFSRGTLSSGVIENPGLLNDEASKRMAQSFITAAGDWHLPKILEQGSKWVESKMTPEDAQMILSRKYTVDDIARWLGVSRTLLENSDPSFGNAEQFWRTFLVQTLDDWLKLFESSVDDQLVVANRKYYARFNRDDFNRGDIAAQAQANTAYVNAGILTVNEVREQGDWRRIPGTADELRQPQNITGKPSSTVPVESPRKPADEPEEDSDQARAIATASAARLLRKEVAEVQKLAVRHAGSEDAFVEGVTAFYDAHAALVAATLHLAEPEARTYCAGQANQVVNGDWLAALDLWKTSAYAEGLAGLALEGVIS